jgi:hypothetical protein
MDVTFDSAALAALCNSKQRLTRRWGQERGSVIARRLVELASVGADAIARLPRARVSSNGSGETIIDFGGEVVVRGAIISDLSDSASAPVDRRTRLVITGLDVLRSDQP